VVPGPPVATENFASARGAVAIFQFIGGKATALDAGAAGRAQVHPAGAAADFGEKTIADDNLYFSTSLPAMMRPDHRKAILVNCALPAALEAVGERWSFLILRAAFNGLAHFEEFQSTLGIARNILSNRLGRLVEHEILQRVPDPSDRRRVAYVLTEKGRALLPALIALRQWGERWISGVPSNPVLVDRQTRHPVATMAVRAADGRALSLNELEWIDQSDLPASGG
jgi:DNA-binding HxlR family transcriptional regulator